MPIWAAAQPRPLFLFAGKEKEAKRKAAKAIKIWVPYLGLQALAYALYKG